MGYKFNTLVNVTGTIASALISLVIVPFALLELGSANYGLLTLVWLVLGYLNLFDFGISKASARYISLSTTQNEVSSVFLNSTTLSIAIGIVGTIITLACYFVFSTVIEKHVTVVDIGKLIFPISLMIPLGTIYSSLLGCLQGRKFFVRYNSILVANTVLIQICPILYSIYIGKDAEGIVFSALGGRVISVFILVVASKSLYSKDRSVRFQFSLVSDLLNFGKWVLGTSIIGPLVAISDRFLIGAMLGTSKAASYSIPFQLSEKSTLLTNSLTQSLYPDLSANNPDISRKRIDAFIELAAFLVFSCAVLLAPIVLELWISKAFAIENRMLFQLILCGFYFSNVAKLTFVYLQSQGKSNILSYLLLIQIPVYVITLYHGITSFGIQGVSIAFTGRMISEFLALKMVNDGLDISVYRQLIFGIALVVIVYISNGL